MDTVRNLAREKKSRQSAASDVAFGHTNGRPAGPVSLPVPERACGEPVEDRRRSRAERDTEEPRLVGATRRLRRVVGARAPGILHETCRACPARLMRGRRGRRQGRGAGTRLLRSRSASRGKGHGTNLLRRCSDVGVVARAMTVCGTNHRCAGMMATARSTGGWEARCCIETGGHCRPRSGWRGPCPSEART